jgi:hypothetical protein
MLKLTKAHRQAQVTSTKVKPGKSSPKNPNPTKPPPQTAKSHVLFSDLLDTLPLEAFMELTRRLLIAVPTLPSGAERSRAILKIVVLCVAEFGSTAQKDERGESSAVYLLEFWWC